MTSHLTVDEAKRFLGRYGFFVRDEGLLAAAVTRPGTSIMGQDAFVSLELKAAVLLGSAARNHPLVDGNKRTSWTLMVLFLWLNGYQHDFDTDSAFDLVVGVAAGRLSLEESSARIADHMVPRES
ncbi:death-on-curing family protein (plasmid) [Pseudarthrobacter chlorophenolicus A6]|uniref:Death-on-curing family protein n=1 Tax=Pseudarthrobacter chlorophenolicus (strain ATCC 700700 / DSM 12829 / CIP 107037 / JCM 12360 / KCTC 9906 / NCIMB 13794 / A6) TaxID=452863 RepID=B8HHW5_PSECP|nr:type II toxin-antitoxin system death-on-curing family toxin [Pseudarthrobacter chlorophenolicus]ACL42012.1 death-on-curing family protein [Pseudarthrobacter chlorophenolicus A6]SDQ20303.1 death on curing protein [Pseudarthrobacter chlorophenolicus]